MKTLPTGKLPADMLRDLLRRYGPSDGRLVVGPGIGRDAAIIDMGDRLLVATSDPVTFATEEIGWYAVHVNANDVACCGATPRWFLATVLLPADATTPALAESIFAQLSDACGELGVALCGGHTEITHGLDRPIVVGQMLGEAPPDRYLTSGGARVGDTLVVTKGIAIEATAIIAKEKRDQLRSIIPASVLDRCARFLHVPGISVVPEAAIARDMPGVHALHDPTEGGIATGLWELAEASSVGLVVDEHRLPILPECDLLAQQFGLNPLGLIASGALLVAVESQHAGALVDRLTREGIPAHAIGEAVPCQNGCVLQSADGSRRPMPTFARDEITRLFDMPDDLEETPDAS